MDLAGSEALKKSGAEGDQVKETTSINLSLSTLGLVINSLSGKASKHIPYRNSVLTKLLKSSLGGNSKTALIIACSPSSLNASESLSTLRFGERAKTVKNKSMLNMVRRGSCSSVAESALMEEIAALQLKLKQAQEEGAANAVTTIEVAPKETLAVLEKLQARTEEDNEELRRKASEIESLNQVLECKDILLREADREMERHMRESQSLQHARDVLSYQLQESIGVNHELIRKIALIAELQELDTLRARLRAAVRTSSSHHDSIVMSPRNSLSPVGLSRQFEGTNGRVTPRTNHTLKSSCWKSVHSMGAEKRMSSSSLSPTTPGVMITPTSALVATSSPYPSPLMGPLLTNSPLPDKIPPRKSLVLSKA